MLDLIYCAGANQELMQAAYDAGFLLGIRSERQIRSSYGFKIDMIDLDYEAPNFQQHLERAAFYRPKYAVVPDLSDKRVDKQDIARAIHQAEQLARYAEIPLIVPKLPGQLDLIPLEFAIGYSIPTSNGAALYHWIELEGRRVHLLGGKPSKQVEDARYISAIATIISADGNMAQKAGLYWASYWNGKKWDHLPPEVFAHDKSERGREAVRRSFINIQAMWRSALNATSTLSA